MIMFLAGIDVVRVASGGLSECAVLQEVVAGVAFCRPEREFQGGMTREADKVGH